MEASASNKTKKSRTLSSAAVATDGEACAMEGASFSLVGREGYVQGASSSVSEALEASLVAQPLSGAAGPLFRDPVDRLPSAVSQRIFLLLPAYDRMRCREVSRAWRAALADGGCWRVLRFSGCEDLPWVRGNTKGLEKFILAAGRAAGGAAEEIDARGLPYKYGLLSKVKLAAEANGASLRVLRISGIRQRLAAGARYSQSVPSWLGSGKLPHLQRLEVDVFADSVGEARRLLDDARQPDGRFKALRIRVLHLHADGVSGNGQYESPRKQQEVAESLAEFLRMAATEHPPFTGLVMDNMPLLHPGLMDAVADAAVACGLESLQLDGPHINHTCLPALSRALRSGRLRSLGLLRGSCVSEGGLRTLDGPGGSHEEFCAALRGSRLDDLTLRGMRLFASPPNGHALLAAVTAHPTLRSLNISWSHTWDAESKAAAAEAIAALLEANAPALTSLDIADCGLAAEHLERILGSLRESTHLTTLECTQLEGASGVNEAFARRVVLPLVQSNVALRTLKWDSSVQCGAVGEEIDRIVQARADSGPRVTCKSAGAAYLS